MSFSVCVCVCYVRVCVRERGKVCRYLVYGMTERKMGKSVLKEKRIEESDEDREKDRSAFCHCTFYSTFLDFIFFLVQVQK